MSFTYGQLKQALQDYTENDETSFVTNLPVFIRTAEERILKSVQLSLFRKNVTATTDTGFQYLAVPSDFLAPFSLSLAGSNGDKVFVEFKDPSFIQTYTPDATTTGIPKYYAQFDIDYFILGPTPNAEYTAEQRRKAQQSKAEQFNPYDHVYRSFSNNNQGMPSSRMLNTRERVQRANGVEIEDIQQTHTFED
jgi:hypothetical protein